MMIEEQSEYWAPYTRKRHRRQEQFEEKVLRKLDHIERQIGKLMATVEEVTAALATLTADLESLAAAAKAEFAKLEEEVAAGTPVDLEPLKTSIEALDARTKEAAGDVPTN